MSIEKIIQVDKDSLENNADIIIVNGEVVLLHRTNKENYTKKEVELLLFKFLNRETYSLPNGEIGRQSLDDFVIEHL